MKKKHLTILAVLAALVLIGAGCSVTSGTRTVMVNGQPETLSIINKRFFWSSQSIKTSITDANGFTFTMSVAKSTVDNEALSTVASLAKDAMAAARSATNTPAPAR